MLRGIYNPVMPAASGPSPTPRTGSTDTRWAVLAHVLSPLTAWVLLGFVPAVLILRVPGQDSEYVARHAIDSLNFQLATSLYGLVAVTLNLLTGGFANALLGPIATLYVAIYLVLVLVNGIKAAAGQPASYLFSIRFVEPDGSRRQWR
jgi:uncharacterized Tic20 family protein